MDEVCFSALDTNTIIITIIDLKEYLAVEAH